MKDFLLQNTNLTEEHLNCEFTVTFYSESFGDMPIGQAVYDGHRFSMSTYQFKKIRDAITSIKIEKR